MDFKINIRYLIVEVICLLYVLLFVYAAVTKLLDFENFQVQLGQSPLLSAFAIWVSYLVPLTELIIALMLLTARFRSIALLGAFGLMTMFSAYIFIILHYSSFVPCSCGGILEKMTWNIHLVFNIVFVVLAALAIVLDFKNKDQKIKRQTKLLPLKSIPISFAMAIGFMILLYAGSEEIIHHENPFIRRYPQHPIKFKGSVDLKFNSYYFAGYANEKIYLGNYTDPLHLLEIDSAIHAKRIKIKFAGKNKNYNMVKTVIQGSYFYLIDGSVPFILRGNISDWSIKKEFTNTPYFSIAQPLDSITFAIRANTKNGANLLGVFSAENTPKVFYNDTLLQKQLDGVFDTDGILLSSEKLQKMIYLYYYRNEYTTTDKKGNLLFRGHTIDTISKAQIKVALLKERGERKMAAPPMVVNESAVICQDLLFVQSKIQGRFEPKDLWKQAEIIDVYNLTTKSYRMSFAIYKNGKEKLHYFYVTHSHLYALIDNDLRVYDLRKILKKEM